MDTSTKAVDMKTSSLRFFLFIDLKYEMLYVVDFINEFDLKKIYEVYCMKHE